MNREELLLFIHCLRQIVVVMVFAGLACFFGKWWIVLFGVFFMTNLHITSEGDDNEG